MDLILGIILIVASLFLIISVLLQSSKSHRLSGTIAGGAETFFGKTKGSTLDKKLSRITTVVAIVFVILVLVVYLAQPGTDKGTEIPHGGNPVSTGDAVITDGTETSPETGDGTETSADTGNTETSAEETNADQTEAETGDETAAPETDAETTSETTAE